MAAVLAGSPSAQVTLSGASGCSGTYADLAAAFTAAGSRDCKITISSDQTLAPRTIPLGQNLTLASSGGERTIQLSSQGALFTISMVASLRLEDGVTLRGISANNSPLVLVEQGGIFYMDGGKITGNIVSAGVTGTKRAAGVGAAGRFNMRGGEISGNTMGGSSAMGGAGGVLVVSQEGFLMTGGTISGNLNTTVNSSGNGAGGVYVSDGRFEMRGGTISGNRQTGDMNRAAGGVYLANTSSMYMYGGIIEGNTSKVSAFGNGDGLFIIGTSKIYFYDSPKIRDGLYAGGQLSVSLRVDGDLATGPSGAEIVVQGSATAGQMAAGINVTDQHQTLSEEMANVFISADKRLIGTVAANHVLWAENFDLSLSITGTMNFGTAAYGYTSIFSSEVGHTLTVSNRKRGTGELTISLTGANASAFELSKTVIDNIEMDSQNEFVVKTVYGLPAGVYTATVIVRGPRDVQEGFNVRFEVTKTRLNVSAANVNTVYGEPAAFTASYQGFVNNETAADLGGELAFNCDYAVGNPAGTYTIVPGGLFSDNYTIVNMYGGMLTVEPREITVNPDDITYGGKVYDGTTGVSWLSVIPLSEASGLINSDAVAASYASVELDDKNAGARKVIFTGLTLRGANAGNYRLSGDTAVKENVPVSKRDLMLKADDKITFAKSEPPQEFYTYTLTGLMNGDTPDVIATGPRFTLSPGFNPASTDRYAIIPSGAAFANYNAVYENGTLTVSEKTDVSGDIQIKDTVIVYNGTPRFPPVIYNGTAYSGPGEYLTYLFIGTVNNGATYNNAAAPSDAGSYIVAVKYEDAGNIGKAMAVLTITPKPITVSGASHSKPYDGARNAFGVRDVKFNGIITGDSVAAASVSAMYDSPNAGTTALGITAVKLSGADSSNYIVNVPVTVTVAGITPKPVTADMFTVAPQDYTGAALTPEPVVAGGVAVTFTVNGYSNHINAGTAQVTVSGTGNYGGTVTLGFQINRIPLKVAAGSTITVYGEPASFKAYYFGLVNGETAASLGRNPDFTCSYNAGDNVGDYDVMPGGITNGNYEIEYVGGTLTVEKRAAVINVTVAGRVYDGGTAVQISGTSIGNRHGSDDVTAVPGTYELVDKNAGNGKAVAFEGWSLGGAKANNYYLVRQPSAKADIAPKEMAVSPDDITYGGKGYDGTATVSWLAVIPVTAKSGVIPGDVFAVSYASAEFDNKDAGSRKVTFSGLSLRGADAGNYNLSGTTVIKEGAIITPRNLILRADDKLVFEGDPLPNFTYRMTGFVAGETGLVFTTRPNFVVNPNYNGGTGRYAIIPSGAVPATGNYIIIYENGILTVSNKQDVSGDIVLEDSSFVYDGKQKYPVPDYSGSLENFEYRYVGVLARGGSYANTIPPTEVGAYIISLIYEDDTHIGKSMAVFRIVPKHITISGASHSKVYDGAKNAFGITVTLSAGDIAEGDTVSAAVKTAMYTGSNAGTTSLQIIAVNMAGPDSLNYTVVTPDTLDVVGIRRKPVTAAMFSVASQVYTGTQRKPVPSAADGGLTVTFNIDGYSSNIEPGMGHITVSGTGNYTGTQTLDFEIIRNSAGGAVDDSTGTVTAQGVGNVTIAGWMYGSYNDTLNSPVPSSPTNDAGAAVIEYKPAGEPDSTYREWPLKNEIPKINAGSYTLRATFPPAGIYGAFSVTADFKVDKGYLGMPYIPGIEDTSYFAEVLRVPARITTAEGLDVNTVLGISADLSGLKIVVGETFISFQADGSDPDFDIWEYNRDVLGGGHYFWEKSRSFEGLAPNSEHVILIRMSDTANYHESNNIRAILVRTLASGPVTVPDVESVVIGSSEKQYSILLEKRVVSSKAEFTVAGPAGSKANVVIFDKLGNAVFKRPSVKSGETVTWDIHRSGRVLADGSYLIVAVSRDKNGKAYKSSVIIGVKK